MLDPGVSNRELELLASYIENNTNYSYEKMAEDYDLIEYVDTSAAPALFRFAIEYSLDEEPYVKPSDPNTFRHPDRGNF